MKDKTLDYIFEVTKDQVIAVGLLKAREQKIYKKIAGDCTIEITKAHRPIADLYRVYIDGDLAGTLVSRREAKNWYHVAGVLVGEQYRGRKIPEAISEQQVRTMRKTPAEILMNCYSKELLMEGKQISLEVINGNVRAWKLYERIGFNLLNDHELDTYAATRKKKIKRDFPIAGGKAIQWEDTGDDMYDIKRWSTNRVYGKKPDDQTFVFIFRRFSKFVETIKLVAATLCFGSPFQFVAHKLSGLRKKDKIDNSTSMFEDYTKLGFDYLQAKKTVAAIETLNMAIELSPHYSVLARTHLINAHLQNDDVEKAIKVGIEAVEMAPDFGLGHNNLASAYYNNAEYKKAIEHFDKAVELGFEPQEKYLKALGLYR